MSFSDVFAVNIMTVYSEESDEWGQSSYTVFGPLKCEYMQGGLMQRDENGQEFVPASTFYPVDSSVTIKRGDYVFLGDSSTSLTPPNESEIVKKVSNTGDDYFNRGNDIEVFT